MTIKMTKTILFILLISGCTANKINNSVTEHKEALSIKEHAVLAVLWQQNAAEYKALCHQAFNTARYQLKPLMSQSKSNKPYAIIVDIDETILDNSPYAAQLIENDINFSKDSWVAWGQKESAKLIPGAYEFVSYAEQLGVEVFYVSNRSQEQLSETINNLKKVGLASADETRVFLKKNTSGKEQRRQKISETHEVLMLIGDNLSDFDQVYDKQNTAQRNSLVDDMKNVFGERFIVLPNPTYGDWEVNGIYDSQMIDSEEQKNKIRSSKLKID